MSQPVAIFFYSLLTAVATAVGALPFFFTKNISKQWLGIFNAVAAGFMGAASILLLDRGFDFGVGSTAVGALAGVLLIVVTEKILDRTGHPSIGDIPKADFKKMLFIVGIMTLHSFTEGVGMGVAFGGGAAFGLLIVLSMAVHNVPEGLAISLVLCARGISPWKAAWWSFFSSLPQPFMAVLAYLFVQVFFPFLPVGLGFAAGAMLWMVCTELIPEALEDTPRGTIAATLVLSTLVMYGFIRFLDGVSQ